MAQPIPKEVWNDHKEAIVRLYIHEDLPLDKKDARNLIDVMKNDYQFSATSAQYQRQFKKWGLTKNLSRDSWESIFQHLDQPDSHNTSHQLRLSGRVLSKKRINRSRRHVRPSNRSAQQARASQLMACNPQIEITELDDLQADTPLASLGEVPAPLRDGTSTSRIANPCRRPGTPDGDHYPDPELLQSPPPISLEIPFLPVYDSSCFQPSSTTPCVLGDLETAESSQGIAGMSSHMPLPSETQHGHGTHRKPVNHNGHIPSDRDLPSRSTIKSISKSVTVHTSSLQLCADLQNKAEHNLQWPQVFSPWRNASFSISQKIPLPILVSICLQKTLSSLTQFAFHYSTDKNDCIAFIDGMVSTLPIAVQKSSSASNYDEDSSAMFFKAVLFSLINNFAGIGHFSPAFFVEFICIHPKLGGHIMRGLGAWDQFVTRPLAENLFRSAVLAGQVGIIRTILPILQNTFRVDLTSLFSEYLGLKCTPLEIAAKMRSIQTLKVVLQAGFDPNQSCPGSFTPGALASFLSEFTEALCSHREKDTDIDILRLLLPYHKNGPGCLHRFVNNHPQHVEAMRLILSYLAPESHDYVFSRILLTIRFTNDADTVINVLKSCQERGCFGQHENWRITLETLVRTATATDDYPLVEFLLDITDCHSYALSTAVRSEDADMVHYLLGRGFDVDPDPFDPFDPFYSTLEWRFPPRHHIGDIIRAAFPHNGVVVITPLAQAIRLQNSHLIQELEERGALNHISEPGRFRAALIAASEIGHEAYVRMLLRKCPKLDAANSQGALLAAMENGHTSVAVRLFEAGACHNDRSRFCHFPHGLLDSALASHDDVMIQLAFECDISINGTAFSIALKDQNTELVDLLLRLGSIATYTTDFLNDIVKLGNREIVKLLLEHGFDPFEPIAGEHTAFGTAVLYGDPIMIDILLTANPNTSSRTLFFEVLCESPQENRQLLINAYLSKYGQNISGFGGDQFIQSFRNKDPDLIKTLLTIQADINSLTSSWHSDAWSPFGYAVKHHNDDMSLLQTLLDAGGDPNCIAWQSERGRTLGQKTAFLVAIDACNAEAVRLLVEAGKADVNKAPGMGILRTPLQEASETSTLGIVKLLLECGAFVDGSPAIRGGATALQLAAIRGHIPIAALLVENGASIHAPGAKVFGRRAFEGAAEHGRLDMLKYLWDAASGRGFSIKELERASALATEQGYPGCVEYIEVLRSGLAFLYEDTDLIVDDSVLELIGTEQP
ncbi:uncharacterized protein E0L32_000946 [Thyridium curvatum]|uniref:Clr5 domain-containing protein n=1 Tax=Thyridium curvatum TaxID=1093900 RepID=A0A507B5Y3_9PEZI|nr:uncharacterized protein E0L32_000946 [Thyridium curvatum]TPX12769.1 hypothetical protein E0L32_000946 [Thyridium curvatum]